MRRTLVVFVAIAAALGAGFTATRPAFDRAAWIADYDHLRSAMERDYANLTGLAGRADLPALHERTDSALRAATSDGEARAAIRHFVSSFADGHFRIEGGPPAFVRTIERRWKEWRRAEPSRAWSPAKACGAFGYDERDGGFSLPLEAMGAVTPVSTRGSFRTAVVRLSGGPSVGVVRIPLLSQHAYRVECEEAWAALRDSVAADCADCEERLYDATGDRLLATLGERLRALRAAGAQALVVDLGGNGGGSEWAEDVARVLTTQPVHSAPAALVRGEATAAIYAREVARIDTMLAGPTLDPRARAALDSARTRYAALAEEARRGCDLAPIWRRGGAAPTCSNLIPATTFTSGAYAHLAAGSLGDARVEAMLYTPARRSRYAGAWAGPLVLLVDRHTASASEEIVSALRDSRAATVVGERTTGAGCGYVGAVRPAVLPHSGTAVRMPNCVRLRADGSNEVLGVVPDVAAGWVNGDDDAARGRKAGDAIRRALSAGR